MSTTATMKREKPIWSFKKVNFNVPIHRVKDIHGSDASSPCGSEGDGPVTDDPACVTCPDCIRLEGPVSK